MKIVVKDANGNVLGTEHLDGSRWVSRNDELVSLDAVEVHYATHGKPTRFEVTNNKGEGLWPGDLENDVPGGDGLHFYPGDLRLTQRPWPLDDGKALSVFVVLTPTGKLYGVYWTQEEAHRKCGMRGATVHRCTVGNHVVDTETWRSE